MMGAETVPSNKSKRNVAIGGLSPSHSLGLRDWLGTPCKHYLLGKKRDRCCLQRLPTTC